MNKKIYEKMSIKDLKLAKEDLQYILDQSEIFYKKTDKKEFLENKIIKLNLAIEEVRKILSEKQNFKNHPLMKKNSESLKKICLENNIKFNCADSKGKLVEKIVTSKKITETSFNYKYSSFDKLDDEQKTFVTKEVEKKITLLYAGPGSGKTTSLVHKAVYLNKNSDKKIYLITFNKINEKVLKERLKYYDITSDKDFKSFKIKIFTFHKLASKLINFNPRFENLSYEEIINKATNRLEKNQSVLTVDYLFVDESHDITNELLYFVKSLIKISNYTILIGDPKQEIYEGSNYFSSLLRSSEDIEKNYLYNNHRSSPEIVDFINRLSRNFFPSFHSEQRCMNRQQGEIKFKKVQLFKTASCLAHDIHNTEHDEILIVGPVSVEKYRIQEIISETNAILHQRGSDKKLSLVLDKKNLNKDTRFISVCTAKKCKGSEKRKVIVLGIDKDYLTYGNVPSEFLKKLIYVSCSRAIEELVIIYSEETEITKLFETETVVFSKSDFFEINNNINCTDCTRNKFNYEKQVFKHNLKCQLGKPNEIIGIYIEIKIALILNLDLDYFEKIFEDSTTFRYRKKGERIREHIEMEDEKIVLIVKKGQQNSWPENFEKLSHSSKIYLIQKLIILGVWKTDDLEFLLELENSQKINDEIVSMATKFRTMFENKISFYQFSHKKHIECVKGTKQDKCKFPPTYSLNSKFDFMTSDGKVIELKYANENEEHFVQTAIYSYVSGKESYLVNLFSGQISRISKLSYGMIQDPLQLIRASNYIRYAKSLENYKRIKISSVYSKNYLDKYISCIDLETPDGEIPSFESNLLEMGGIITHCSGDVVNLINYGTKFNLEKTRFGYDREMFNANSEDFKAQSSKFRENLGEIIHLRWHCDDYKFVNFNKQDEEIIDVCKLYKLWRKKNNVETRDETTLSHMCLDLFGGGLIFNPHCGYEDALMTLVCFYAMIEK